MYNDNNMYQMTMALRTFCRLWRGNLVIYLYYIIAYGARVRVVCTLDTRLQRDNRRGGGGGGRYSHDDPKR